MNISASYSVPVTPTGTDAPPPEEKPKDQTPLKQETPPADQKPNEQTPPADRPAWLPEKFKSPEEMAKAYAELEKKQGTPPADKPADQKPADPKPEDKKEEKPAPKPEDLPKPFQKFSDEFAKDGKLSDESYKELAEKHQLSKEQVDLYIRGVQATQREYTEAVYKETGGEEGFQKLSEWANENVSKEELAAVDKALASGDKSAAALAVRGLQARYQAENGKEPNLLGGESSSSSGVVPFKSTAEVVKAMSDPRYSKDSAFRDGVDARLAISDVI